MERGKVESVGLDVVVSTMASDSHTWNLVFLQLVLEELGHRVTARSRYEHTLLTEC